MPNPNLEGSQGPAIAGSSRELVEDRVLYLKYPPGYTPKRMTHAMRALPLLVDRIDDLTVFLAEALRRTENCGAADTLERVGGSVISCARSLVELRQPSRHLDDHHQQYPEPQARMDRSRD